MPTSERRAGRLRVLAEQRIEYAVGVAISRWLEELQRVIVAEAGGLLGQSLTAAPSGFDPSIQAIEAVTASYERWRTDTQQLILPSVEVAFGEAFRQARAGSEFSTNRAQTEFLATVSDRLKIWPAGAFEELRPELLEAISEGETIEQIRDRVGEVLGINAESRRIRADIGVVDAELTDDTLTPHERRDLRATRRDLWEAHAASLKEWEWKARRIARTESQGAVQGGRLAAMSAMAQASGDRWYKRWVATDDERVRATHRVADGQVVPIDGLFRVGGFMLPHPAAPITIAPHETINCRCTLSFYNHDQLQDALQGKDGSIGVIRPGGVRMGPDDPDDADVVIAEVARPGERVAPARGEDHGQSLPAEHAEPEDVALTDEREAPLPDLTEVSSDELVAFMDQANDARDDRLYEWVEAEWLRREGPDDPEWDDPVEPDPDDPIDDVELDADPAPDLEADTSPEPLPDPPKPWRPPEDTYDDSWPDPWALDPVDDTVPPTRFEQAETAFNDAIAAGVDDDDTINQLIAAMDEAAAADAADAETTRLANEQSDRIIALIDGGEHPDEAESIVTGVPVERIRRDRFIAEARADGHTGRGFDELVAAAWRAAVALDYLAAENATRGHMVKSRYKLTVDPFDLWTLNETQARKYMSEEVAAWFDENGRLTKSEFRRRILSGGTASDGYNGRGDFLQ
ncbi:phage minor head protein [Williamsia herbipolensis]|uniref:Phage minor head protein n=1 Tax=Williamsia herbipolensis TaxID=1603258 RepID=A0AAU4K035_9NOCA|nr:phage minor head protein [Williamsia herbipolensis]